MRALLGHLLASGLIEIGPLLSVLAHLQSEGRGEGRVHKYQYIAMIPQHVHFKNVTSLLKSHSREQLLFFCKHT